MDLTKGASLIPGIGFVTINTILLLYFILLYFIYVLAGGFTIFIQSLRNSYVILCKLLYFLCFLCKLLFLNLFKAPSLFVYFIPSIDFVSAEEARTGETSIY